MVVLVLIHPGTYLVNVRRQLFLSNNCLELFALILIEGCIRLKILIRYIFIYFISHLDILP